MATADGRAHRGHGQRCEAFFSAVAPVALPRIAGPAPKAIRLRVAGSGQGKTGPDSHAVGKLGYPLATRPGKQGVRV